MILEPTASASSTESYARTFIRADLSSESDEQYGEASIRKIYGRWIATDVQARAVGRLIGGLYRDNPKMASFKLDAKDRAYWLGDVVRIEHFRDVDEYGDPQIQYWQIISAEETAPGEEVTYEAVNTVVTSTFSYIMATGSADYPTAIPDKNCYIGNASGLLSDGEPAGAIA